MDPLDGAGLNGWTPVHIRTGTGTPAVDWAIVERPFLDPFFEQTAYAAMQRPFNQVFARSTSLEALDTLRVSVAPAGLIFHMSRCGSTLIAQMLSRLTSAIVLSEPQPVDALLRLHGRVPGLTDEILAARLRALVGALAGPNAGRSRVFVKFHAWHVLELPFIARAFPGVPWAFVFREPRAVLASQNRAPGAEVLAGTIDPAYLGLSAQAAYAVAPDEYAARAVAAFCDAALSNAAPGRGVFFDYPGLPGGVFAELLPFFGVTATEGEKSAMHAAAQLDAKDQESTFRAPAARANTTALIDDLAARFLDARYAALRAPSR